MVNLPEKQIRGITILDKDGYGTVEASAARIINLGSPIDGYDAATKEYVDSVTVAGTTIAVTARGSTSAIPGTISANGGAGPASGAVTIDLPHMEIHTGSGTVSIGESADAASSTSTSVLVGYNAHSGSSNAVVIGYNAGRNSSGSGTGTVSSGIVIGNGSGAAVFNNGIRLGNSTDDSVTLAETISIGNDQLSTTSGAANSGSMSYSLVIGPRACQNMVVGTAGQYNIIMGYLAMSGTDTDIGRENIIMGYQAAQNCQDGDTESNVSIGNFVGPNAASGSPAIRDVRIGYLAGAATTTGSGTADTVALGYFSGSALTTGQYNTFIGSTSGLNLTDGSYNILIGYDTQTPAASYSDYINIGNVYHGQHTSGFGSVGKAAISRAGTPDISTQTPELLVYGNSDGDDEPPLGLISTGSNGVEIDFYVGDRDPDGVITPNSAGDLYVRSDGYNSTIYQYDGYNWGQVGGRSTLSETLDLGNTTDGYDIDLTFGSVITSSDGNVTVQDNLDVFGDGYVSNDFTIGGKLTVVGLIDPTGMVFDNQSSVPGGTPSANKSTLWIRDGYSAVITDQDGIDKELSFSTSTDGYSNPVNYGFHERKIKRFSRPGGSSAVIVQVMSYQEYISRLGFVPDSSDPGNRTGIGVRVWLHAAPATGSGFDGLQIFGSATIVNYGPTNFNVSGVATEGHELGDSGTLNFNMDEVNGITVEYDLAGPGEDLNCVMDCEIITSGPYLPDSVPSS